MKAIIQNAPRSQRGVVLISSLLLLLVVTIMALSMFRSFGMQEKIAGNVREKQRALQSANSAQQYAEWWLANQSGAVFAVSMGSGSAADVVCTTCGEPLPTGRRRRISPVVMRITFPTGNVDIPAGTSVMLGRDPAESLVAAAFAQFDNVSRRHATVLVDDAGHASIRDENSTNGTFVNDDRVLPGAEVRLVDGDRVRLAADVTGDVSLPQGEPDPSRLSRNGR